MVILTLEERTKIRFRVLFLGTNMAKFQPLLVLLPEFDVLFSSSNETSRLEFEKLDSLTTDCVTSQPLIPHTLPFKG